MTIGVIYLLSIYFMIYKIEQKKNISDCVFRDVYIYNIYNERFGRYYVYHTFFSCKQSVERFFYDKNIPVYDYYHVFVYCVYSVRTE